MEETKRRMRKESGRRWTKQDKNLLLSIISENPMKFETPTAQIFYRNITQRYPQFEVYSWKGMRDKMRNLKATYFKAVDWFQNSGGELNQEDSETTMRAYILKVCEDFDILQNVFASKNNIIPLTIPHTTEINFENKNNTISLSVPDAADVCSNPAAISGIPEVSAETVQPKDECSHVFNPSDDMQFLVESPSSNNNRTELRQRLQSNNSTAYLAQAQIDKTVYLREKLDFSKKIEERKLKLKEEYFAIEREKIALEREKMKEESRLREMGVSNNFELNKMRLEREMDLKELELKYKYKK